MDEELTKILNKINEQKIAYSKWINELITELSNNSRYDKELYLINKSWIEKYQQQIFNESHNEYELFSLYKQFENIDNSDLLSLKDFNKLPKLFILNDKCWFSFVKDENIEKPIKLKGQFINKMIIIDFIKEKNYTIYCIFFLDKKRQLRQGYLQINELEKEKNNYFLDFMNQYNKELTDERMEFQLNHCKYLIFEYKDIKIKNYNTTNFPNNININNSIKENFISLESTEIKNCPETQNSTNIKISVEKKDFLNKKRSNKDNLQNKKYFHKKIKIDNNNILKKEIPENKEEFKNKKEEVIHITEQNLNQKEKIIKNKNKRNTSPQLIKKKKCLNINEINNENSNLEDFLPSETIHKVSTPGIIGLLNIGATCYMNATLQCFSNINRLRINLLNKEIYKDLEINKNSNKKLSFALAEVLSNLWEKLEHSFYSPEYFKKTISEMNPLFKGIAANDPKDLVLFLLETIHKELNNPLNNNINNNNHFVNNHNFLEVYNDFLSYYNRKNSSIVSDEFYGFSNNMTRCGYCSTTIHNVQTFNILFFPLEEVRKFKNYNHNNVSILDCFEYYEKTDTYPSFYCNDCKQNYFAYSQTKLVYTPKTLILNLNRGKGIEFNVNILFEEYLNIKKYIFDNNSQYYYELTGVICHYGSNDMGGHFIAYCKNYNNCQWYKYNDQMVTKCFFKDVIGSGMPYVLFYSYIKI